MQTNLAPEITISTFRGYTQENMPYFHEIHEEYRKAGKIKDQYRAGKWMCYSGVRWFGVDFSLDELAYKRHGEKILGYPCNRAVDAVKCFILRECGEFIFDTLSEKASALTRFMENYGEKHYKVSASEIAVISEFLVFLMMPAEQIHEVEETIRREKTGAVRCRELSHLINYLAIADEVNEMYSAGMSDEMFVYWFPVWFWVNITFVIPLRATEMLVTPLSCIRRLDGKVYLTLRRTMLKKRGKHVEHEVETDYREFTYQIPDDSKVRIIEKYIRLTEGNERKYLFTHSRYMINRMLSLQSFNNLLAQFVDEFLIGKSKFDYARFASGITEFEYVTAGDSRPIAMANLFFQDTGSEICRDLADHENISTSVTYFSNVAKTIENASIMRFSRRMAFGEQDIGKVKKYELLLKEWEGDRESGCCRSPFRPMETGDIRDCEEQGHLQDCFGCRYYIPGTKELKETVEKRKQSIDEAAKAMLSAMMDPKKAEKMEADMEKLALDMQTSAKRYQTASDEKAKEDYVRWRRKQSTPKTTC